MVLDQNGEKCALIKIITTGTDFRFDVGSLGIRKVEQKAGEIWLYVPFGIKKIKMNHQKFGYCEYPTTVSIERARTYVMRLHTKAVSEGGNENFGQITVNSNPEGAEVYLDGVNVGFTPYYYEYAIPGKHRISVRKVGFFDSDSNVDIRKGENSTIDETLVKSCDIQNKSDRVDITIKDVKFSMIRVDGGTFIMGATQEQRDTKVDEQPAHVVTLSDYYIGETEVTNALWAAVMGNSPSHTSYNAPQMPVNMISWDDCMKFVNRLSTLTGLQFSLPTESQWEYAARGGNRTQKNLFAGSNNAKDVGWYKKNSRMEVKEVKQKKPNELGLYDMSGNVFEWCYDWYGLYKDEVKSNPTGPNTGTQRVIRSGSCAAKERELRVSCRAANPPSSQFSAIGMRLAMTEY